MKLDKTKYVLKAWGLRFTPDAWSELCEEKRFIEAFNALFDTDSFMEFDRLVITTALIQEDMQDSWIMARNL